MLAPWIAMLAVAMPLPFRVAAPAHAAAAALSLSATGWRQQVSLQLCPDSGRHYAAAARLAAAAVAWLSPPAARGATRPPSPAAAFWGLHAAAHLALSCLVLAWLHHSDRRRRREWAQQLWPAPTAPHRSKAAAPGHTEATPTTLAAAWVLCPLFWLGCLLWLHPAAPCPSLNCTKL